MQWTSFFLDTNHVDLTLHPTGLGEWDFGLGLDNVVNVTNIATPENNASQSAIPDSKPKLII